MNTATGTSPGTGVPNGAMVPTAQMDLVADILAACINSAGGTAGDGSSCGSLFTLTTPGSIAPTNAIAALLDLANNPTLNTTTLYALASPTGPFQPTPAVMPANLGVQLNAPAALYAYQSSLSFGAWPSGFSAPVQTITVMNFTNAPVPLAPAISGPGANSFGLSQGNCGATLAPQVYCTYGVEFSASTVGTQNAFFVLSNSTANSPIEVPLSGVSLAANAGPVTLTESSLNYTVAGTTQDVVVENYGSTPLLISSVVFSNFGSNTVYLANGSFSQTNNCGASLAAQSVCTISVESTGIAWAPGNLPSTFTATMTILDNASAGPQTVSLSSTNTSEVSGGLSFTGSAVGVPVTGTLSISAEFRNSTASGNYGIGGADPGDFSVKPKFLRSFWDRLMFGHCDVHSRCDWSSECSASGEWNQSICPPDWDYSGRFGARARICGGSISVFGITHFADCAGPPWGYGSGDVDDYQQRHYDVQLLGCFVRSKRDQLHGERQQLRIGCAAIQLRCHHRDDRS